MFTRRCLAHAFLSVAISLAGFVETMAAPSLVDVLQSQVVLFKSFLFTDEFCRIFATVSRETRVGNLEEFRNAESAFDNLIQMLLYLKFYPNLSLSVSLDEDDQPVTNLLSLDPGVKVPDWKCFCQVTPTLLETRRHGTSVAHKMATWHCPPVLLLFGAAR